MINNVNYNNSVRFSARCNQVKMLDRDGNFTGEVIGEEFKYADMPVYNFADYMAEKMGFPDTESFFEYLHGNRELPEKEDDENSIKKANVSGISGDIQIADFGELYEFYPTGDPDRDYQIQMGLNYNKTCYDGTNYWDYEKLTAEEDFTGMSAAEIYKAIYEKYQHCYGENFIEINAIPYTRPPHSEDFYGGIIDKFYNELETAVGDCSERQQARREALYGDMDDNDVRAAIIEKYAADGLTNADLYKITAEMDRCGVGGGIHSALYSVLTKDRSQMLYNWVNYRIETSVEESSAMHEQMLASPLDTDMLEYIEIYGKAMSITNPTFNSAVGQLRQLCGGFSGSVSVDSVSAASTKNPEFTWIRL